MRNVWMKAVLSGIVLCFACVSGARAQGAAVRQEAEGPLTNASVVKLVRAGFSEKTLIAIIRARPTRFDLSPERLVELKKNRVSEKVILVMLARQEPAEVEGETWADDPDSFFKDSGGEARARRGTNPGEVNIFGSSAGARGRTRSRAGRGGSEGETLTTGSATVRILRPPAEAGGAAAPKLEKTPTLNNDSVVELVEAGFSEGTIIRRIEQSPADFNLSPTSLADLRRRRVTEPVIAAMRAAMSDDAPLNPKK